MSITMLIASQVYDFYTCDTTFLYIYIYVTVMMPTWVKHLQRKTNEDNHILSKKLMNDGCGYFGNDFVKLPVEIIPTHQLTKK